MDTQEALQLAIQTMDIARDRADVQAADWRRYGEALQFNRRESRMAAAHSDKLTEAIAVLERLLAPTPS